jgi:hypothetical protein
MRKARFWKFKEMLIKRTEISRLETNMEESTNNLISSMSMNGRVNQLRVSLMKNLGLLLKDHSSSFLNCHQTDILT